MTYLKFKTLALVASLAAIGGYAAFGRGGPRPNEVYENAEAAPARIAWYATLDSALAEAKRSQRPILFTSAAPNCTGVSGIW